MNRRRIFFLLYLSFFSSSVFSFDFTIVEDNKIYSDKYWYKLLHYKNGKSEIDSQEFFLAKDGKTNPKAELFATLDAIVDDNSTFCRFPSRVEWLYQKIPLLHKIKSYTSCPPLEKILKSYNAQSVVLVFPTAHINSPASMFGHSFLRIDSDNNLSLTSNAINYAAKTRESNGLIFAYQGLFGGYEGRYSILPYYKKIKEYNHLERRDIWEYRLNLTPKEIKKLLTHLYELKDLYADYYFFSENCSYNLLWLLEVARDDLKLVDNFSYKAIPIDTIRKVYEAGLIESENFRASKTKEIEAIFEMIDEQREVLDIIDSKRYEDLEKLKNSDKVYGYDLAIELLRLKRSKRNIDKKSYVKDLLSLLRGRSKLEKKKAYKIKKPPNPLLGHKSERLSIALDNKDTFSFGYKPAFHDFYDVDYGFIGGSYINFFHLQLKKEKKEKLKLEKFDLVNIRSLSIRDQIFKPLSWGVSFGLDDFRDSIHGLLNLEVGLSYAIESFYTFFMLKSDLYMRKKAIVSIAPKVGIVKSFKNLKIGALSYKDFFSDGITKEHHEIFTTYQLNQNLALNLKYDIDKIEQKEERKTKVSLYYYF